MKFVRYLRHLFHRTPPSNYFCFTEKCFSNKIAKSPLKRKKWKLLVRKTTRHAKKDLNTTYRSSHRKCSVKKDVLKNSANFTGKRLCWSLFLINLQALCRSLFFNKVAGLGLKIKCRCF